VAVIYPDVPHWPLGMVALSVLTLGAITALVLWQCRSRPYLLTGWGWFVGTLVPVIGLIRVGNQSIADRYLYLPAIGFFIAIVWGVVEVMEHRAARRAVLAAATATILILLSLATQSQILHWQNTDTLFRHPLAVTRNH